MAKVRETGFEALVITADTPVLGRRERDLRTGFAIPPGIGVGAVDHESPTPLSAFAQMSAALTWDDVGRLREASGLPIVVKGVLTAEDARLACEHGAGAIVVSNHGGRQLDGVSATIDALPEVVEAVDGRLEVLVDGGIRRGTDVVTALALGARAVMIGRPYLWGLAVAGDRGVRWVIETLRAEVELAMALTGAVSVEAIGSTMVARAPGIRS
jgi:isopentenyl diphosphate isomerase/L-lactate dehydrogenase-like FMN-dependent dehydrogenase